MRHLFELLADRAIQGRVIVPMDIGPYGRVAIEIPLAEAVLKPRTMAGDQYERLMIGRDPIAHLGKRMPHVRFVELDESLGLVFHLSPLTKDRPISRSKRGP